MRPAARGARRATRRLRRAASGPAAAAARELATASGATARDAELQARLAAARAAQQSHDWVRTGEGSLRRCRLCLQAWRGAARARLPACPGVPARIRPILADAHGTGHHLHVAVHPRDTPLVVCMRCGGWTEGATSDRRRKLRAFCRPPTAYGAACLRAARSGRHPTRDTSAPGYGLRHTGLVPVLDAHFEEATDEEGGEQPPAPRPGS